MGIYVASISDFVKKRSLLVARERTEVEWKPHGEDPRARSLGRDDPKAICSNVLILKSAYFIPTPRPEAPRSGLEGRIQYAASRRRPPGASFETRGFASLLRMRRLGVSSLALTHNRTNFESVTLISPRLPDAPDLPIERNAARLKNPAPNLLAERLEIGGGRGPEIDEKVAVHGRHLSAAMS